MRTYLLLFIKDVMQRFKYKSEKFVKFETSVHFVRSWVKVTLALDLQLYANKFHKQIFFIKVSRTIRYFNLYNILILYKISA